MRPMKRWALALGVAGGATVLSAQQPPAPTFRSQVEAVQVDVFVTDRAGNPVRNLRLEDFQVLEEGTAQTITSFSEVNIPISPPAPYAPLAARPDVATNSGSDGRLYVIAVDEVGADLALRARHYLTTFIERHFEANDVGVVVNIGRGLSSQAQDFTSDRGLLLAAINRLKGWPRASSLPGPKPEPEPPEFAARSRAAALKALIASLAGIQGRRKALIYITEDVGDVYSVIDYKSGVRSLEFEDLRTAMTDAMRGGVAIYAINACGLSPGGMLGETLSNDTGPCDVDLERAAAFRRMSEATGGFAVVNSNSVSDAFERIVRESSSYYILGFTSTNERRDGLYRRLDVRVLRPGLTVRARDGYIAPSRSRSQAEDRRTNATPAGLRDVIAAPVANGAVPMKVFAAAFKGPEGNDARVVITAEFDVSRLALAAAGDTMRGSLELASAAISDGGKVTRGQPQVFDVRLKPDSYAQAMAHGFRTQSTITLTPGRYQLRVAGGNTQAQRMGSVMYDLEVPDFGKGRLTLSAVALSAPGDDRPITVMPRGANVLPFFPTLNREFAAGTRISLYVEVYDNAGGRQPNTLELKVEVRDQQGRIVRSGSDRRTRTTKGTETFQVEVPLIVEAGIYALHVEATSGTDSVRRDVPIRVR